MILVSPERCLAGISSKVMDVPLVSYFVITRLTVLKGIVLQRMWNSQKRYLVLNDCFVLILQPVTLKSVWSTCVHHDRDWYFLFFSSRWGGYSPELGKVIESHCGGLDVFDAPCFCIVLIFQFSVHACVCSYICSHGSSSLLTHPRRRWRPT